MPTMDDAIALIAQFFAGTETYLRHLYSRPMPAWDALEWFLINAAVFVSLACLVPGGRAQPKWRRDTITDLLYCFCGPYIVGPVFSVSLVFLTSLEAIHFLRMHWDLAALSLPLQIFLILVATDFLQYWAHRLFHRAPLWRFHAIHHAGQHVDWLTSVRFHPVNFILYSTIINAAVVAAGFSSDAFILLIPFNVLYGPLVHANLDWTWGPLKYVLVSPVFHRWHHTATDEGGNKNFAPVFSFWDLIFGTYYMPKGRIPETFGTPHEPITGNILQQLVYPFLPRSVFTKRLEESAGGVPTPQN